MHVGRPGLATPTPAVRLLIYPRDLREHAIGVVFALGVAKVKR